MKYKIKSSNDNKTIEHMVMDKHDWVLWYGPYKSNCYQVQYLFRYVLTDRKHANCVFQEVVYERGEQLTFQSRKAAMRYAKKHKDEIAEDYKKRNCGEEARWIMGAQWHGKGVFYIDLTK